MSTSFLDGPDGRRLAYVATPATDPEAGPGVVFLGGFVSDMTGTKAMFLEEWAKAHGRAFLRLDYSGHGQSSGAFEDGCIGDWAADAAAVIAAATAGPQILVGSSMGGWIALLLAQRMAAQETGNVAGLVGIAAAPDFTEDSVWAGMDEAARARLMAEGRVVSPSDYSPEGYVFTRKLIEDGRRHLVLRAPLALDCPVRLIHGTADTDVPVAVALRLLEHAEAADMSLRLIKNADHRLSDTASLGVLVDAISEIDAAVT